MVKAFIRYFSIIVFCTFFIFLFNSRNVSADFEPEKNTTSISVSGKKDNGKTYINININVKYQKGMDTTQAKFFLCTTGEGDAKLDSCINDVGSSLIASGNYIELSNRSAESFVSTREATFADKNITSNDFSFNVNSFDVSETDESQKFVIFVFTSYCSVRSKSGDEFVGCQYHYPDNKALQEGVKNYVSLVFTGGDVLSSRSIATEIEDEGINNMVNKISEIVYGTVMPIIWALLGIFLVVKGTLLGVQIVKAADEPQIRQEKVGALKWLIIGVAIAAGASGAVQAIAGYLSGAFKIGG